MSTVLHWANFMQSTIWTVGSGKREPRWDQTVVQWYIDVPACSNDACEWSSGGWPLAQEDRGLIKWEMLVQEFAVFVCVSAAFKASHASSNFSG